MREVLAKQRSPVFSAFPNMRCTQQPRAASRSTILETGSHWFHFGLALPVAVGELGRSAEE